MPTYEYRCTSCGEHLEVVQAFSDDPLTECPACGQRLKKVFHTVGIAFKGSGFYRNDSRSAAATSSSASSGGASSGGSAERPGGSSESSGASSPADKSRGSNGDGASSKSSTTPAGTSGAGVKSA
ncbi:MAG TPA: FmdB family zinc ribbon protein [Acidimicrobiales bacterium]|jgi:putative FmdB family regulatory protein|nr:FmdB family zinc ribbon protein [Acidimicrobiales bacterium]